MARLPKALRVSRQASLGYHQQQNLGIYARGPADQPSDVPDALRGHLAIERSTIASTVQAIADAAANSHKRRG